MLELLLTGAIGIAAASPVPQLDCVEIRSPLKLEAGTPFRKTIQGGLEFQSSKDWGIPVRPAGDRPLDYLWLVSPPLRTAPERKFGPGYNIVIAADSAKLKRLLRFLINQTDYDSAIEAIALEDRAETLWRLDILGRGTLVLYVDKYELKGDNSAWIRFHGEAYVPKGK